jgi:hypothetical protein
MTLRVPAQSSDDLDVDFVSDYAPLGLDAKLGCAQRPGRPNVDAAITVLRQPQVQHDGGRIATHRQITVGAPPSTLIRRHTLSTKGQSRVVDSVQNRVADMPVAPAMTGADAPGIKNGCHTYHGCQVGHDDRPNGDRDLARDLSQP